MTIHYSERAHGRPWHLFGTPNRPAFHACHRSRGLVHLDLRGVDDPSQFDYQPQRAAIQRRLGYNSPAPDPHTDRNTGTIERWTTRRRRSAFSPSNRSDLTDAERAEWGRRFGVAVARGAAKDAGNRPTDRRLSGASEISGVQRSRQQALEAAWANMCAQNRCYTGDPAGMGSSS